MVLLGMYHHFSPKSPNIIQLPLSPAPGCKVGQRPSMSKALPSNTGGLMASTRAKLTVCPVVLAKDLDTPELPQNRWISPQICLKKKTDGRF